MTGSVTDRELTEVSDRPARDYIKGLRFLRDIRFPRFPMAAGELWPHGFDPRHGLGGTARDYYAAIDRGDDRFDFAGGVCLVQDVQLVPMSPEEIEESKRIEAILASTVVHPRRV